jgi:hypothetical protein
MWQEGDVVFESGLRKMIINGRCFGFFGISFDEITY